MDTENRPLLFLDVDVPLNPYAYAAGPMKQPDGYTEHLITWRNEPTPRRAWLNPTHHPVPALLHHVNPRVGLREGDFAALAEFAASLREGSEAPPKTPGGASCRYDRLCQKWPHCPRHSVSLRRVSAIEKRATRRRNAFTCSSAGRPAILPTRSIRGAR